VPDPEPRSGVPSKTKAGSRRDIPASDAEPTAATPPAVEPPSPSPSASVGPGLTRFVAVDLKLAGGGAPSAAGLQWLVEKGYRTLLDLRETSEVPASFITDVTNKGLRYVALPMNLRTIDRDHVDRFQFELAAVEARPLFFFDSNGTRAGALWYIRRIVADKVDPQMARREAEELGLVDGAAWLAATDYVAKAGSPHATSSSNSSEARATSPLVAVLEPPPSGTPASERADSSSHSTEATRPDSSPSGPRLADQPPSHGEALPIPGARPSRPLRPEAGGTPALPATASVSAASASGAAVEPSPSSADPSKFDDTTAWHPFAAMVITGLSLPLAYWSRSIVPTILTKTRASLPAPALRPKSLRAGSGE
jgi:protein tyrosine phosphatase (PTP) superfamily phosphohydrolase (DUF442 family)